MSDLKKKDLELIIKRLKREPNDVERGIFSVMWSEHCSYRTSKRYLKKLFSESRRKIVGPGENAGILDIDDGDFVAFKIESHNHPSAIEPYQGAATGVGGILRDIFTMGARPVASGDPLRFGKMTDPHSRHLLEEVVRGISDYGNSVGVPTIAGETQFDDSYGINCLVNVFALGIGKINNIVRGVASGPGNLILYFGSRTGRDGVHGATFASDELDERSKEDRPSVQIANPFEEKKLIEACCEIAERSFVVAMQDMGAAGLTSSSVEMAARGGVGFELDLSLVPLRQDDVTFYEMMLSETQERMLAVVQEDKLPAICEMLDRNEIEWAVIGKVISDKKLLLKNKEKIIVDIPLDILLEEVPPANTKTKKLKREKKYFMENRIESDVFKKIISSDHVNSKRFIFEQYDYRVGDDTIKIPGDGYSVLRIDKKDKAVSLNFLGLEDAVYLNPYHGGYNTIARSALEHLIAGFEPIGYTDCLNYGNPEDPEILYEFSQSTKGMDAASRLFDIPVISGNVSFYNESTEGAIKPLMEVGMAGLIKGLKNIIPNYFVSNDSIIYCLRLSSTSISPSVYSKFIENIYEGSIGRFNVKHLKKFMKAVPELRKYYRSARIQSRGGNFTTCFKMSLENDICFRLYQKDIEHLFAEGSGIIVFEVTRDQKEAFEKMICGLSFEIIGETISGDKIHVDDMVLDHKEISRGYFESFERNFV